MPLRSVASALLLILLLPLAGVSTGPISVAAGRVDITAPVRYPMGGYSARKGSSEGTHDPLLAKVLLIKTGNLQVGIITYDLLSFNSERVAREAKQKLGFTQVLQIASHTHSGPVAKDSGAPSADSWVHGVEDKALAALKEAQTRYVPARLSVGQGVALLCHNRRRVNADGTVTMLWRNAERIPTSPVDPRVGVIRFSDASGKPLAVLVNYACHAVVLGADNLQYSADWPGFMYHYVEKQLGNGALVYFLPGASGDINPYNAEQPSSEDAFGVAQKMGESLGQTVLAVLKRMPPGNDTPEIEIAQETYTFKERFDPTKELAVQVTRMLLDKNTGILAVPGEMFVSHAIRLQDRVPLPRTFLVSNAYGGQGQLAAYIPTISAAMEGGYGANYATRIEVGAGEWIVTRSVVWFYERLGRLDNAPDLSR